MKKNILIILSIFASALLQANTSQSLDLLRNKIEQHLINELAPRTEGKLTISADKIDPRLNLKACAEEKLVLFNPYETPLLKTSIMGVKCQEDDNRWTLYVPVKISIYKIVVAAKHPLIKGDLINNEDLYELEMNIQQLKQGYFTQKDTLIGQICKQNIAADTPITPYNIELAKVINKGEHISIVASSDTLRVSMEGVALDSGAVGDTIRVKNLKSNKVLQAQVSASKEVKVTI